MSAAWLDHRKALLMELQDMGGSGRAEGERPETFAHRFYPVTEHLRMLDPNVVLVVGPRGSGKTQIARILTEGNLYTAVTRHAPAVQCPRGPCQWIRAFPSERGGLDPVVGLRDFARSHPGGGEAMRDLWMAYLLRTLAPVMSPAEAAPLEPVLRCPGADLEATYAAFLGVATASVVALDDLDQRLESENRYVFVTYDEIDTLGAGDWRIIEQAAAGLVAVWAAYSRRWRRIRAKLFLRTDIFERHARAGGADLAKLAAGRVSLTWSDKDLYSMLLKRLANGAQGLQEYVQQVRGVSWDHDQTLGAIPQMRTWQDARPVVERMVGVYMGTNQKKGLAFRWLIDHVRDGLGRPSPRPFVRLLEESATQELRQLQPLQRPRLLEPASLRRALDTVSYDHVIQSRDEWPWIDDVVERLKQNSLVPWESEKEVARLLDQTPADTGAVPPFNGRELLTYLLDLGILRRRSDGRVDVPDLYLAGLGLRRKGGVLKRR